MQFEQQSPRFIEDAARRIAQEELLNPILSKMREKKYSQKIIDGTTISQVTVDQGTGLVLVEITSEYDAETGFDVATAREEGTRDHLVRPRDAKGVLRFVLKTGQILFRKFARVKGIRASHIIRDTFRQRQLIFQQKLTEEIIQFYSRTVNQ